MGPLFIYLDHATVKVGENEMLRRKTVKNPKKRALKRPSDK
jgi:hypothetical protein